MIKSMNKRKENSLFSLISNSLFANIGKKINADVVFILFNAGTSRFILCLHRTIQTALERKKQRHLDVFFFVSSPCSIQ